VSTSADSGRASASRRGVRWLLVVVAIVVAAWLAGLIWFTRQMPSAVEDPGRPTDAIVVLTGGSERVRTGLDILLTGLGRKLFVSGVDPAVEIEALMESIEGSGAATSCCVDLGHEAGNTRQNAIETADWLASQGYDSMRLVTAGYHMPRSLLEFRAVLPDATIVPHAVFPDHVKHDEWWRWPGTTALYIDEYNKYLAACVRLLIDGVLSDRTGS